VILIMTTNAGAMEMAKAPIGFERLEREGDDKEAIERAFSPEFRNRLDAVISFAHLPPEVVARVVDKFILELELQLEEHGVILEMTDGARAWLARTGYDRQMGARPLARVIQEHIKKPLADELLFGRLASGGVALVREEEGKLVLDYPDPTGRNLPAKRKDRKPPALVE